MRRALMLGAVVCLAGSTVVALIHLTGRRGSFLPKVYAQEEEEGCSNATLRGNYGLSGDGFVFPSGAPFAEVAVVATDGAGNSSGSFTINVFGSTSSTSGTFSGKYTVNADCTGISTNMQSNGTVSHFTFAIVDHGRQVRTVQTDSNAVWTATAIRQ